MADDEKILAEAKKLPIDERTAHTNWKVRSAAYEDIKTASERAGFGDPALMEYGPMLAKSMGDSNAAALDKALDAMNALLAQIDEQSVGRFCERTCSGIASKCLSSRPGTVQKCSDVMLAFVELEQGEKVVQYLIGALSNKVPKVVVAALEILTRAMSLYGPTAVPVAPLLKGVPPMFDSKDAKARDQAKALLVEIGRYVGAGVIRAAVFDKMGDAFKGDMEAKLAELPPGKAKPERFTRREAEQQAAAAQVTEIAEGDTGAAGGEPAARAAQAAADTDQESDAYDFVEPRDILPELRKDFWEGLASKKWSERKASLAQLRELASSPRLAPGDFSDVCREVRKVITKDSNVACISEAIGATGMLARGLRQNFAGSARSFCPVLLECQKQKNTGMSKAIEEALTLMHKHCWSLVDVIEDLVAALGHQHPKVREETLLWLIDAITREPKPGLAKLDKPLLPVVAKLAEDATPALREGAAKFLVAYAVKCGSATAVDKACAQMDKSRKEKLDEQVLEALKASRPARPGAPKPAAAARAAPAAAARQPDVETARPATAPATARGSKPTSRPAANKAVKAAAAGSQPAENGVAGGGEADNESALAGAVMTKQDTVDKFTALFGEGTVAALSDANWKARLEAMDVLLGAAVDSGMMGQCSVLVQGMQHLPGWDEKMFQVMGKAFELIRLLASNPEAPFSRRDAYAAANGCIEKLADMKLRGPSFDTLSAAAEAVGPQFLANLVHSKAAAHKNPKVLMEALNWLSQTVDDFGLQELNVKSLIDWVKEDLGSGNAGVRTAAVRLLGVMHRFVGAPLKDLISNDVKPALMTAIETEFASNPLNPSFTPKRTNRAAKPKAGGAKAGKAGKAAAAAAGDDSAAAATFDPNELLPRTDISGQVTSALLAKLANSNWKERQAGLEEVNQIIAAAGNRITSDLGGELISALKPRLSDSNAALVTATLHLMAKLATAMGKPWGREGRVLLSPAIKCISDTKTLIRNGVVEMMDAWVAVAAPEPVFEELAEAASLPKCSTDGKKLAMDWMGATLAAGRAGEGCLGTMVRTAGGGGQDKSSEVRESASRLMAALLEHVGLMEVTQAANALSGSGQQAAIDAITKATGAAPPTVAPAATGKLLTGSSARASTASVRPASASTATATRSSQPNKLLSSSVSTLPKGGRLLSKSVSASSAGAMMATAAGGDGPLLAMDTKKDDRAKKAKYKTSRFELRPDEPATLEAELSPLVAASLRPLLFAKDFKKHCEAAELIRCALPGMFEEVVACLDLLLRWSVLRMVEGNTQTLVKVLDMCKSIFDALIDNGYRMSESEAKSFLPGVVEKCGQSQDRIKMDFRELMKKACGVYPATKVLAFVKDGLESKNNRTRVAVCEEIGSMIEREGPRMYSGPKGGELLSSAARMVADRDKDTRLAVLSMLEVVYAIEGEEATWRLLGKLPDQQKTIIEERFKAKDRELAKRGLRAGHRAAEYSGREGSALDTAGASHIPAPPAASSSQLRPATAPVGQDRSRGAAAGSNQHDVSVPTSLNPLTAPLLAAAADKLATLSTNSSWRQSREVYHSAEMDPVEDLDERVRGLIRGMASADTETCINGMKGMCHELTDVTKKGAGYEERLAPLGDGIIKTVADKTQMFFEQALQGVHTPRAADFYRPCKYCLNVLMNFYGGNVLPKAVGESTLTHLLTVLLLRLVDEVVAQLQEGDAVLKALNVLMLNVLEKSNRTHVFGTLLHLLVYPPDPILRHAEPEKMSFRWYDLVVKCLIKITKTLPATIEGIDMSRLLMSIHTFFESLGVEEIRQRGAREDKPLRMVKTILHEICKLLGERVYEYTKGIPRGTGGEADPIIYPYIELNLQTLVSSAAFRNTAAPADASTTTRNAALHTAPLPSGNTIPAVHASAAPVHAPSQRPATATSALHTSPGPAGTTLGGPPAGGITPGRLGPHVGAAAATAAWVSSLPPVAPSVKLQSVPGGQQDKALVTIFGRVAKRETRDEAMLDLYTYLRAHPDADLDSILASSSEPFKQLVYKGLQRAQVQLQDRMAGVTAEGTAHQLPQRHPVPPLATAAAGPTPLDTQGVADGTGSVRSSIASPKLERSVSEGRVGSANLAELRDRMSKLQGEVKQGFAASANASQVSILQDRMRRQLSRTSDERSG